MKTPAILIAAFFGIGAFGSALAGMGNASDIPVRMAPGTKASGGPPPDRLVTAKIPPGNATRFLPPENSHPIDNNRLSEFPLQDNYIMGAYDIAQGIGLSASTQAPVRNALEGFDSRMNIIPGGNIDLGSTSAIALPGYAASYRSGTIDQIDNSIRNYGYGPVIPEPETWALMLAGLGLLGFARRRNLTK